MSFDEMMEWSKKVKEYDSPFNFLKFPQGIHLVRIVAAEDDAYFRSYTQHDCGHEKDYRSWLCWDYIMDNKEVREYLAEKELLTEADAKLAAKYGDPVCTTLEVIKKYVKDIEPVYKAMRTKIRVVMNVFYVAQIYPEKPSEKTPKPGLYVLEQSAFFNKQIISAMEKDSSFEGEDPLALLSSESGKVMSIQVEGEGIGKNRRQYTIDFKGKPSPVVFCEDGANPYLASNKNKRQGLPEDFEIYNLRDVEAVRFTAYQETINQLKAVKTIKSIMDQIGYEVGGDQPSDNPLDDNYDDKFAKKTVGKPIAVKEIKEDSWTKQVNGKKEKKEAWEDEENIKEERAKVQSKKVVEVEEDDDEIPFDDDFDLEESNLVTPAENTKFAKTSREKDTFEKAVPKSDPAKEVITNAPKTKRKIF